MVRPKILLPDAEPLKNIPQNLIGRDFAGDAAEVTESFAEVLGEKVGGGEAEAVLDTVQGRQGIAESFKMARVCYERGFGGRVQVAPRAGQRVAEFF